MKKTYALLLLIPFSFAFGQNLTTNGGFESWNEGVVESWTSEAGTAISQNTEHVTEGSSSALFNVITQTQGDTDFRQVINVTPGATYDVSVDIYQADSAARARIYAADYGTYSDETIVGEWQTITYSFTAADATAEVGLRFYDVEANWTEAGSFIYADNFVVEESETSGTVTEVADLAALRASATGTTVYQLTGEAVITMLHSNRNQKWIQDGTAAILIDDAAGVITSAYNQYDGITGLTGTLSEYNGVLQFIPTADPGAATSTGNTVVPQVVTIAEFNANYNDYESELIKIEYLNTAVTGVWETGTNYNFTSSDVPEDIVVVRTNFYSADYIGTELPTATVHLVGIASEFNGTAQLFPRSLTDIITNLAVNDVDFNTSNIKIAVANNQIYVSGFEAQKVAIYNVNGQLVANSTSVASLTKGAYIAVLTNAEGQKVSVKFMKK